MANMNVAIALSTTGAAAASSAIGGLVNTLGSIGLAAAGIESVGRALGGLVGGNAELETYTVQLSTLMGSADAAKDRLRELADFGAKTPFELPEVVRAEKVLLGFGLTGAKALELTKQSGAELRTTIGDIAAGTGHSFEEIALNFGKFSAGATGEAISRLQEMGVVTREQLTDMGVQFAKSGELVSPLPEAMAAAVKIANEKFGGGMEKLSNTFEGRLSTLSDNFHQAMQTLVAPIFELVSPAMQGLNDLLGSSGFQQAIKDVGVAIGGVVQVFQGLGEALLNLENTDALQLGLEKLLGIDSESIGPAMDAISAVTDAIKTVGGVLSDFGSKIVSGDFGGALNMAAGLVGDLVQAVKDWVLGPGPGQIVDALVGLADSAWSWIQTAAARAGEFLGGLVQSIKDWVAAGGPQQVAAALFNLAEGAWEWVQEAVKTAAAKLGPILESLRQWATETAWPEVKRIGDSLGQALYDGLDQGFNAAIDAGGLRPGLETLSDLIVKLGIPDNLRVSWALWGNTLGIVGGWLQRVNEALGGGKGTNVLVSALGLAVSGILGTLGQYASALETIALKVNDFVRMLDRVISGKDTVVGAFRDILSAVMAPVTFLTGVDMVAIGTSMVEGLVNGITSKITDLEAAASRLANIVPDWMKRLLESHSPSMVMFRIGIDIGQGLIEGLGAQKPGVIGATASLMSGVLGQVSKYGDLIHDEVSGILVELARVGGGPPNAPHGPTGGPASGLSASGRAGPVPGGSASSGLPWGGEFGYPHPYTGDPRMNPPGFVPAPLQSHPRFETGGVVPGPLGSPMVAVVHGGETITPPGQGAGTTAHFYGDVNVFGVSLIDALNELSQMVG